MYLIIRVTHICTGVRARTHTHKLRNRERETDREKERSSIHLLNPQMIRKFGATTV